MRRLGGQITDLMRIDLRVVQLLGGPLRAHPQRRWTGELSFRLQPEPLLHDGALVAVDDVAGVGQLRHEVADVEEPFVPRRADHVVFDVHPVARGEDQGRGWPGGGPHQDPARVVERNREAGHRQHGGRQIDEADQFVAHGSWRDGRAECLRPADQQRHAQARVVQRSLRAGHAVAVIAPVEDDGVVAQTVGVELFQDLVDLRVHVGDVVVDASQLLPDRRRVRVVGRHLHLDRIGDERLALADRAGREDLALVRDLEVEHGEERLARIGAVAPVRRATELVPDGERRAELIVGLGSGCSCSSRPRAGTQETPSRRTAGRPGRGRAVRPRCPWSCACAARRGWSGTSR